MTKYSGVIIVDTFEVIRSYENEILIKWYLEQCKYDNMSDEEINKILVSILL